MVYYTKNVIGMRGGKEPIPEHFQGLAGLTGCGGIVDMDQIQNSTELQYLLHSAASLTSK